MKSIAIPVGIDVSKDVLEVFVARARGPKRLKVTNDETGVARLLSELSDGSYVVSMESSGRYESLAYRALVRAGHKVRLQNPRQARRLAEGLGADAKTDEIDAQILSVTLGFCKPTVPRSEQREALGDLSRTICTLVKERSGHKKRLQVPGFSESAKKQLEAVIAAQDAAIAVLKKEFKSAVEVSKLARAYELCQTVPGVGEDTARIVVSELHDDLSSMSVRQICSYAALTPLDDASGKSVRRSKLKVHGNKLLKGAFYMPAENRIGKAAWARKIYSDRRARGLNHQQAIVPVMRKILAQVAAVLKRGTRWQADPPARA